MKNHSYVFPCWFDFHVFLLLFSLWVVSFTCFYLYAFSILAWHYPPQVCTEARELYIRFLCSRTYYSSSTSMVSYFYSNNSKRCVIYTSSHAKDSSLGDWWWNDGQSNDHRHLTHPVDCTHYSTLLIWADLEQITTALRWMTSRRDNPTISGQNW